MVLKPEKKRKKKKNLPGITRPQPRNHPRASSPSGLLARPTRPQADPRVFPLSLCVDDERAHSLLPPPAGPRMSALQSSSSSVFEPDSVEITESIPWYPDRFPCAASPYKGLRRRSRSVASNPPRNQALDAALRRVRDPAEPGVELPPPRAPPIPFWTEPRTQSTSRWAARHPGVFLSRNGARKREVTVRRRAPPGCAERRFQIFTKLPLN